VIILTLLVNTLSLHSENCSELLQCQLHLRNTKQAQRVGHDRA